MLPKNPITLFNVYSPPDKQINLQPVQAEEKSWIMLVDFNSHSPSWGYPQLNAKGEDLENWMISNKVVLINKPTDPPTFYSRTWRTTTHPDLAMATDDIHGISKREVTDQLGGSDHRPVIICIQKLLSNNNTKLRASWNYKKANWDQYAEILEGKLKLLDLTKDVNQTARDFNNAVLESAKAAIPRGRRRNYQPNWSSKMEALHNDLSKARDDMESNPTNTNVQTHNKAKAMFIREKVQATRQGWHEKTASLNMDKDMQSLWKLVGNLNNDNSSKSKTVIEDNNKLKTGKEAANAFAELYRTTSTINMPRERVREVREETKTILFSANEENDSSMNEPFTLKELKHAISKLKSKKAPGPDGVSTDMLKHLSNTSKKVLLKIINTSWDTGIVPSIWKEAEIIPIPKKGKEKKNPLSYRPISLLSNVGKIMERMVNRRLIYLLESKDILAPSQTGYRKYRNTEDQLALLVQDIENSFQEKQKTLAVFFDLSRAFDTVWKEGLMLKLLKAGIRKNMYSWLHHYLHARTARVKLDGVQSRKIKLLEGVPQGGVLSPTLFLLFINDITTTIAKHVENSLHADDLAVWTSSEHASTAQYRM